MARRITIDPRTIQEARFAARRILEPEVMDGSDEVEAYLDGVATAHLDRMDDGFVRSVVRAAPPGARILDVGTGTAAIPVKIALRRADITVTGIDLSDEMLRAARERIRGAKLGRRVRVRSGSARRIPFRRGAYDMVVSNSLLHHLPDPVPLFDEIARVLAPGGRVFMRDLRRPGPARMETHIRRHGRFYKGEMLRLFSDSVRAAFKVFEMARMIGESRLRGCRVRPQLEIYVVIEGRPRRRR